MDNRTWHFTDKSKWAPGAWQDEPDKEQWTDAETGFACLIVRSDNGALCGYVGVPEGHPWYRVSCWDLSAPVHGGLNFSQLCAGDPEGHCICHVPAPGEPEPLWWLGFDCAHSWDIAPAISEVVPKGLFKRLSEMQTYRTVEYVKANCAQLALEAKNALPDV